MIGAGVALLTAGVLVLGYLGWQYFGTNWVSHRRQAAITGDLRDAWRSGQASVEVDQGTATALVRIPRFGDDYAVPLLEGDSDEVLASGFGHLDGTADPGQVGNVVIAGHRVTHGEPLRDMAELEAGDRVLIDTKRTTYTYELLTDGDALTVDFAADWVLAPDPRNPEEGGVQPPQRSGQRLLTLVTCAELFHTDERWVAFAQLVSQKPRKG